MTTRQDDKDQKAARELVQRFEGFRPNFYEDIGHILTIGIGYTPIVKGENGDWVLRPYYEKELKAGGVVLTAKQDIDLHIVARKMNAGDRASAGVFNELKQVSITPKGARDLFNYLYKDYRDIARKAVGEQVYDGLSPERKAVLFSIAYQSPATMNKIGPAITEKMLANEKDEKDEKDKKNKPNKMAQVAEIILGAAPDFDKIRWQAMAAIFNDPTLCGKYMVKPGDTLGVIAQRCGTTVKKMMTVNGMGNANKIRAGQVLILPENAAKGCSGSVSETGTAATNADAGDTDAGIPNDDEATSNPVVASYWDEGQWDNAPTGGEGAPGSEPGETPPGFRVAVGDLNDPARDLIDRATFVQGDPEDILEKHPNLWTRKETRTVQGSPLYGRPGPRQEDVIKAVASWYSRVFGDGEVAYDETGRMIEPKPKAGVPEKPTEAVDVLGRPLSRGVARIARHVVTGAKTKADVQRSVLAAQKAFNMLEPDTPLREDGDFGPKSRMAARRAVRALGAGKAEERLGLGRFASFVERANKSGSASGLAFETERVLGPLLRARAERGDDWARRDRPRSTAPRSPRPEAVALQETLNEIGARTIGSDFKPLREDGWIGPKTTGVFRNVARAVGPRRFTRHLAHSLCFLDETPESGSAFDA